MRFGLGRMANAPLSLIDARETRVTQIQDLPPSSVELKLVLFEKRSRSQWTAILAASVLFHIFFFFVAIQLPSFIPPAEPERSVIVKRVRLYLPPDVLTQKTPNRAKISKSIDLADLLSKPSQRGQQARPQPSVKHFEIPRQALPQRAANKTPQILPEAPKVAATQTQAPPPPGAANGLPAAAPPPPDSAGPFQNVGAETPPNPHPTITPPKSDLRTPLNGVQQSGNGQHLIISDANNSEPSPAAPGSVAHPGAPHSAVELQSDPQGADFKPYLTRILAIVRANWRRVMPESARMGMLHGRTVLEFIIDRNGNIPKLVLADSSGSDPLDRAAIAGLSMSNPLPPLPSDFKGFQVRLAFTFTYNVSAK